MSIELNQPLRTRTATYAATRFNSASPVKQRIALLDGAISAALGAADAIERGELERAHERASICRGILLELAWMIRGDSMPQLTSAMSGLTVYLHGRMVQAMTERSSAPARCVARLLESERDAWAERIKSAATTVATPWPTNAVA